MRLREIKWREMVSQIFLLTWEGQTWLMVCCLSHTRGLVLVPLAVARERDNKLDFILLQEEKCYYPVEDDSLGEADLDWLPASLVAVWRGACADKLQELSRRYAPDAAVAETRAIELLDAHRSAFAPDIITCYLGYVNQATAPQAYPVRVEALQAPQFCGTLLCDAPEVNLSAGAKLKFVIVRQREQGGRIICLSVLAD